MILRPPALLSPLVLAALWPASAAAQEAVWARIGRIEILRDPGGCTARVTNDYGLLSVQRRNLDGTRQLRLSVPGWPYAEGTEYRVKLRGFGPAQEMEITATGFRDAAGNGGIAFAVDTPEMIKRLGADTGTYLSSKEAPREHLVSRNPGGGHLERCTVELSRIDRGSGEPAVTAASNIEMYIGNDDYPPAALRSGDQGRTSLMLTVSAQGLVSDCAVTGSSGSSLLEMTACMLYSRRFRARPALDRQGRPTESKIPAALTWRIPEE